MTEDNILSNEFLKQYEGKQPKWGFNGLGYIIYKRTYARQLPDGKSEEWWQTVARCINSVQKIGAGYTKQEAERLFDYVFNLKCSFAGRSLWQLGTSTVDRFGGNSLQNCFYTDVVRLEDFLFIFEALMLGSGMGFSVRREHIHQLPKIKAGVEIKHLKTNDADFICPDSREGWVSLLRKVLEAYFITGESFTYSTILIRGYGEAIKGFGGTASGPQILVDGIANICSVFNSRAKKKLRSIDVLDIVNIIGSIVVSGNIRRTALLALGDSDDILFLRAKRWDLGNIPNWRAVSNNTIDADDFSYIMPEFWKGYEGNGEPYGLFNTKLTQTQGRLGEFVSDSANGTNACAEASLEGGAERQSKKGGGEACNLATIFLNNILSKEELFDCSILLYKAQKAICSLRFLHDGSEQIIHEHFRLGQSVTGICQSLDKLEWLDACYKHLTSFDKEWSKKKGWPKSIKYTMVQPSGTLSLLAGSTPGVHPGYSKYYIRRVRMASTDDLVPLCRESGYHIEYVRRFDKTEDHKTVIVEFPCKSGDDALISANMSALDQLELVKKMQTLWADNAVSCTVYYKKEELQSIKDWLKTNYKTSIKSASFLLHSEHGFDQTPYEEITEERYNELMKKIKGVEGQKIQSGGSLDVECASGHCPVK